MSIKTPLSHLFPFLSFVILVLLCRYKHVSMLNLMNSVAQVVMICV